MPNDPTLPLGPAPSPAEAAVPCPPPAWVYLLRCPDGSLYAGWTNDLARRLRAHRSGTGAKYTKSHGKADVQLAYAERCADKSAALQREIELKKLTKPQKEALAADWAARTAVTVRMATVADAAAVVAIYNWYVTHTTATFQYDTATEADYRRNIADTLQAAPFLVACNAAGEVLGYACAHPWHARTAYAWDVETTIYCAPHGVAQGVGRKLYVALLALLRAQGYCNAYALVTSPNPASDAFHKAMGFARFGREKRTGYKFGRWLDLSYWGLQLRPGTGAPAPVRKVLPPEEAAAILQQCAAGAAQA